MYINPSVDPDVASLVPEYRALSLVVEAGSVIDASIASRALKECCEAATKGEPAWAQEHLNQWTEVFKRFGVKAKRSPCSADALRKRVLKDGVLPIIDPVVDLYNAISVKYAIPVGGENLAAYVGQPRLTIATGTELFDTMRDGHLVDENPEPGEIIWCDDKSVTCRRWNWRQGVRTRLDSTAHHMWFILESLPAMPMRSLYESGEELACGLKLMMANVSVQKSLLTASGLVACNEHKDSAQTFSVI